MSLRNTILALLAAGVSAAAEATQGYLQFEALTPTTIAPGGSVNFRAMFVKSQDYLSYYYGDPEPAAWFGIQTWTVSGMDFLEEVFTEVRLTVGSSAGNALTFFDAPGVPLGGGNHYSTSWDFSLTFDAVGTVGVEPLATWVSATTARGDQALGERNCYPDPDAGIVCNDWALTSSNYDNLIDTSGTAGWGTLEVQVVPEPPAWALWLAGLGLLGQAGRQRFAFVSQFHNSDVIPVG